MIVVADTTPLHYLLLIDEIALLPALFDHILVPPAVLAELTHPSAPASVQRWAQRPPAWLDCQTPPEAPPNEVSRLGPGERDALRLALARRADAVLMDDQDARREAHRLGLTAIGTLRVLATAAQAGRVDLPSAIARLQQTSFRADAALLQAILDRTERPR